MTDPRPGLEVFPVAIGHYADPGLPNLDVEAEVAAVAELLAEFGADCVAWPIPMAARGGDEVNARLTRWSGSPQPHTVLYWVGHGWSNGEDATLAHATSPKHVGQQGMTAARLAEVLHAREGRGHPDLWAIVVVDTCQSAKFVQLLAAEVNRRLRERRMLLVGVSPQGATTLGRFSATLRTVVADTFRTDETIELWELAKELRRTLPDGAEIVLNHVKPDQALRRVRPPLIVGAPVDIADEIDVALDAVTMDERRHFIPKAQGAELGEQSWYFEGRRDEALTVATWLRANNRGMLVITGAAGCGKSALLGHLIVQSRPELRRTLARHHLLTEAAEPERPADNIFDLVLHLTGLTALDIIARLAAGTGSGAPPDRGGLSAAIDWLTRRIARKAPLTVIVDALDEAVDPLTVADAVLRRLATLPGVRIVVGTRRSTREGPDQPAPADENLLDALRTTKVDTITVTRDDASINRYVRKRLAAAVDRALLDAHPDDIAHAATAIGSSGQEFLFARLAVHEIIATPNLLSPTGIDRLLRRDHRHLFASAVDRLTEQRSSNYPLLRALAFARGRGLPIRDGIWATVAIALHHNTPIVDDDIQHLLRAAAPYLLLDREHNQTVYRLAHRTFAEQFTAETTPTPRDREAHHAIAQHLTAHAEQDHTQAINPYPAHHLSAHAASGGQPTWEALANHPTVLDQLNPTAIASDAMRTAYGHFPLPPAIAGVIGARHQLATARHSDRQGLRQLAMTRHTNIHNPAAHEPTNPGCWTVTWAALQPSPTHLTLTSHTSTVDAIVAVPMPDGRTLLATGSHDGTVQLWDPATASPIGDPLTRHTKPRRGRRRRAAAAGWPVVAVPMPDGRTLLATGSRDGTVQLWDPATASPIGEPLVGHTNAVMAAVAVPMPNGNTLLATGAFDGTVRLWDPATASPIGDPLTSHTKPRRGRRRRAAAAVRSLVAVPMPDGHTLLATSTLDGTLQMWDPATASPIGEPLVGHTNAVTAVVAVPMPNGNTLLATGAFDGTVRLWDPATASPIADPLTGHTKYPTAVVAVPMPNGNTLLATGAFDGTVRLWDPATASPIADPLTSHTNQDGAAGRAAAEVRSVLAVPRPDGHTLLATGAFDGTVRLWDPATASPIGVPLVGHTKMVTAVVAVPMPDGHTLLATGSWDGTVRLWDPVAASPIADPLTVHTNAVKAMAAVPMPDGRTLLATKSTDHTVRPRLRDPITGAQVSDPNTVYTNARLGVAEIPLPDGRTLLARRIYDGTVVVWDPDPTTGILVNEKPWFRLHFPRRRTRIVDRLTGHTHSVKTVVAVPMPDGRTLLATGSTDGTVRLWDPTTGTPLGDPLTRHAKAVEAVVAVPMPDGRTLLATGSTDGTVRLWDLTDGSEFHALHTGKGVNALAHLGDDQLAIGFDDGIAVISHPVTPRLASATMARSNRSKTWPIRWE